jgi:hypothetical protein
MVDDEHGVLVCHSRALSVWWFFILLRRRIAAGRTCWQDYGKARMLTAKLAVSDP